MKTKGAKLYTKTITLPNGKRKFLRSADPKELEQKYQRLKAEMGAGVDVTCTATVAELAQIWYDIYKKPNLKAGGRAAVLNTVNNHILPIIGSMKVRDVKPIHIRQVMAAEAGMSKSLQDKTLQALRGIFRAAVSNGMIIRTPVDEELKAEGTVPPEKVALTVKQSQMLLAATKGTRAHVCVAIMLGSGLRREEVCGLSWGDIDLGPEPTITVSRVRTFYSSAGEFSEDLKSEAAQRTVSIPLWLAEILREEKQQTNSTWVLHKLDGSPVSKIVFQNLWRSIESRTTTDPSLLGKPISPKHPRIKYGIDFHVHPHMLRHTCITRWLEAGLDVKAVQYMAGHASSDMTLDVYGHYLEEERRALTGKAVRESNVLSAVGQ